MVPKSPPIAPRHGIALIEDDPYAPLRPEVIRALATLAGLLVQPSLTARAVV